MNSTLKDFLVARLHEHSELHIKTWEKCGRFGEYELVSPERLEPFIDEILKEYDEIYETQLSRQ